MKIIDIARMAEVSPATVSRIINQSGYASKENRQKVMRIIRENNYTPNSIGRNLRRSQTNTILALFPDLSNSYFSELIDGMEKRAVDLGYGLVVAKSNLNRETESRYLSMLPGRSIDGFISFVYSENAEEMNELCAQYPFVQAGEYNGNIRSSRVMHDSVGAAREAVSFMTGKGRKRVAFLYNRYAVSSSPMREQGYRQALENAKLAVDPALSVACEHSHVSAYKACEQLMSMDNPPMAFFCTSDELASGAIHCLVNRGLRVGRDVDVIGCDNTSLAQNYMPSITSINVPSYEIGTSAVDLVVEKIRDVGSVNKCIFLPHELVIRESAH